MSGQKAADGTTVYLTEVAFQRETVVAGGGSRRVAVWKSGTPGLFGTAHTTGTTVREAVQESVREFADAWVVANKEEGNGTKEGP